MHDHVCFTAPIDYCVELSLVYETFCKNCSHFILARYNWPDVVNTKYHVITGGISSPNFPSLYPSDSNCSYIIDVSNSVGIFVTFQDFDLEDR